MKDVGTHAPLDVRDKRVLRYVSRLGDAVPESFLLASSEIVPHARSLGAANSTLG